MEKDKKISTLRDLEKALIGTKTEISTLKTLEKRLAAETTNIDKWKVEAHRLLDEATKNLDRWGELLADPILAGHDSPRRREKVQENAKGICDCIQKFSAAISGVRRHFKKAHGVDPDAQDELERLRRSLEELHQKMRHIADDWV